MSFTKMSPKYHYWSQIFSGNVNYCNLILQRKLESPHGVQTSTKVVEYTEYDPDLPRNVLNPSLLTIIIIIMYLYSAQYLHILQD